MSLELAAGAMGSRAHMDFHALERLRQTHPGWRLLTADHAPLIVSFLHRTFVEPNVRKLPQADIVALLDDYLHHLRETLGPEAFPRTPTEYLDEWADQRHAWLRKYYPPDSDEPHFDLSLAAQAALVWLSRLGQRQFVGTESRLMMVLDLLRQIVEGTEENPDARIAELERRREQIDADIARIRAGGQVELLDPTQVRDRFQQMDDTAHGILDDFRAVEHSLRELDRKMRERIATWDGGKGALIEEMFGERDAISDSDTGRSFRAFWDFLMSSARQDELSALLERVFHLDAVRQLNPDRRLLRIHYDWLTAGETTQRTVARLSEQLRRYLEDQAFLENRRIMQLVREVEQLALAMRASPPPGPLMTVDEAGPSVQFPMDRPLFTPLVKPRIEDRVLVEGDDLIAAEALFDQVYVDKARLRANVRQALQFQPEVTLSALIEEHPLEQGLAELVAYLSLATDDKKTIIDESTTASFAWTDALKRYRRATLPVVVFRR